MVPERLLFDKSNISTRTNLLSSKGISPSNSLPNKFKYFKLERWLSSTGIEPEKLLFARFKISSDSS
uniref:Putative ovule protein n=1 Tax=Solanum chacoense TaxID=4108 RepID=A0A0V0GNI3_SOLCH